MCVNVVMPQTCYVNVLGLILRGEIKSRSRKLVMHKAEPGRRSKTVKHFEFTFVPHDEHSMFCQDINSICRSLVTVN